MLPLHYPPSIFRAVSAGRGRTCKMPVVEPKPGSAILRFTLLSTCQCVYQFRHRLYRAQPPCRSIKARRQCFLFNNDQSAVPFFALIYIRMLRQALISRCKLYPLFFSPFLDSQRFSPFHYPKV